jgi:Asp-tRNA(Asn)/Glu-tRNA(Gln) amidotransferase A subunit family amidase
MLQNTFLRDFRAVSGMADRYRQWLGAEGSLHFVSSSPWQLHTPLAQFLSKSGFPASTMHLKSVRFRDETLFDLFKKGTETKPAVIKEILARYPSRNFILVGDSGEQDPEVYAELLRQHPGQISRAFIRNVTDETRDNERFHRVFKGIETNRWALFETADDLRADDAFFTFDPIRASIGDVHNAISSGSFSCEDIVTTYLTRIEKLDQSIGLNAIVFPNRAALNRAREIDAALARGKQPGPLYCVPVLLKDNMDTADMPTSGGSIALKASMPPDDAFIVRRLREADAIIVAKTNMAEWAFSPRQTLSSSYGATANAYDLRHVPAGSSGGTASGIAAGFGVVGMGSDTGNSIRGPSSHLSLFGIRSSMGLVSRDGVIPLAFDRDVVGPMTRTVEDSARVLKVIAGSDPADPYTQLIPDGMLPDYVDALDPDALKGRRIGVLRALVHTEDATPEVIALFEQALADLQAAGAILDDGFTITNLEAHMEASNFCVRFRYDMRQYLQSLGNDAPLKDVMEVLETGQYSPYIEERLKFFGANPADVPPADLDPPCPDYPNHPGRQAFLNDVVDSMDQADVDAIVYPTWTNPPAPMDRASEEYRGDNSQLIAPATGLPAVSVPMGYSSGRLPAGLQVLGRPFSEALLIALSYAYEQRTRHWRPPEGFRLE